jgi:hypothetical protein
MTAQQFMVRIKARPGTDVAQTLIDLLGMLDTHGSETCAALALKLRDAYNDKGGKDQ